MLINKTFVHQAGDKKLYYDARSNNHQDIKCKFEWTVIFCILEVLYSFGYYVIYPLFLLIVRQYWFKNCLRDSDLGWVEYFAFQRWYWFHKKLINFITYIILFKRISGLVKFAKLYIEINLNSLDTGRAVSRCPLPHTNSEWFTVCFFKQRHSLTRNILAETRY